MRLYKLIPVMALMILLIGCTNQQMDYSQMFAKLDGEAITYKDVMIRYQISEENKQTFLKEEVTVTQAKEDGITITSEEITVRMKSTFPGETQQEMYGNIVERSFYEEQGEKLGMTPVTYFSMWNESYHTTESYVQAYVSKHFGSISEADDVSKWTQEVESHLDGLVETFMDSGRLVID
ncbi:hypothetical protein [Alteribacter aurantiacus]|uniref:hypothetical protein n=1 Tax=Alteribacter aurantiacus TaxID=254410 RepID=UPI000479DC9B|nr:hypothetical protein [Alteribacter aurantiacus]